jgi:endonuclease/exonuclease/phosphatase family metal-dependent hydrolase
MARRVVPMQIGTAPNPSANTTLNFRGPQSTRPLPRWYWYSDAQRRWRKFDDGDDTTRNDALETYSERPGPLRVGFVRPLGIKVLTWDVASRSGTFSFRDGTSRRFERLSQREAAEVQADNFVYDNSGNVAVTDRLLADFAHVVPMFREMIDRELEQARTHAFMYHSYHNVALLYDLGACLARVAMPDATTNANRDALLPRTDRSEFNNRSPNAVVTNFSRWYNGTDVAMGNPPGRTFPNIGMSFVLNAFKPNPEATVVSVFQRGYNPGDSPPLGPVLDELLARFGVSSVRSRLLQLAIESDVDVTSFFGGGDAHFFEREADGDEWRPVSAPLHAALMQAYADFLAHDGQVGPEARTELGWTGTLQRDGPGLQAYGSATGPTGAARQIRVVSVNAGQYLQLGVPLDMVQDVAYSALPFGLPDPDPSHALRRIDQRADLTDGGQARVIARPDLMWSPRVTQRVYQFSRGAAAARDGYLRSIEALLREALGVGGLVRARRVFEPPPIVVRSHNVWYKNAQSDALVDAMAMATTYDFFCIQEATTGMLTAVDALLPPTHVLLYDRACGSTTTWAALVYRRERFQLLGRPHYGCFRSRDGSMDRGRPIVAAVFRDQHLGRQMMVASMHAPHGGGVAYGLESNMSYTTSAALEAASVPWPTVDHVVFAGDFNRDDWGTNRSLAPPTAVAELQGAQGALDAMQPTLGDRAVDNVLWGSRSFKYTLELASFVAEANKRGSDHRPVEARFLA